MTRWSMIIYLRRCVGCQACTVACQVNNKLPLGIFWNIVTTVGPLGTYPTSRFYHIPRPCFHCANPPCVPCCPAGASSQREDGIVTIDQNKCIGCGACIMSCPYGARIRNKELGIAQKCTFCMDLITQGKEPYCVSTCHQKARIFGDLDNPESEISKLINTENTTQLMPELGTDPHVYYIQP